MKLATLVQRVTGVPMEPRAAVATYDPATGRTTLYAGGGSPVRQKHDLAGVLNVPPERVRVVMHDVGGNYGTRGGFFPEFALVAWAARRVGRPVKWTCERHESFLTDYQGRDLALDAELALDADGQFLAMRGSDTSNIGAHTVSFATLQKSVEVMTSIYHVPAACFRARARADQHGAHAALSGHRAPGGDVRDGAADRSRLPAIRLRSARPAPQEPDPGTIAALCQSVRDDVRQRPLSPGHGDGAGARRMGRLCRPEQRKRDGAASAAASPSPTMSTPGPA